MVWLIRHPRLFERFFADPTTDDIRIDKFGLVAGLRRGIDADLNDRRQIPRPWAWRAEGGAILDKVQRTRAAPVNVRRA